MVQVEERLDYDTADELLAHGQGPTAEALRLLKDISERLALHRQARGAVSFRRPEWKIRVSPEAEEIAVKLIVTDSPSRALVAEMMILTNHLLAQWAAENNVPIIYRTQAPPIEPLPENQDPADPVLFIKLRRFIHPATLSLFPAQHWGLGLESYTQITSPLRRYGDLVLQRQIGAALAKEPLPYNQEDLLKVLATVEATEKEMKRVEAAVTSHWALEYVSRLKDKSGLQGKVIGEAAGGYRVELELCGAQGILLDERPHQIGEQVLVKVKSVKPREGVLRLVP
jgi:exoribonuclease-2